ncbi:MAG: tetratricopeptide repeat protein [Treponema sp.]|nr:tetratricopeptide repeat protein [Treponema sp.]
MEKQFEKTTVSEKVAEFVTSIRSVLLVVVIVLVVALATYGTIVTVSVKSAEKGLADIDSISYLMTKDSASLAEDELKGRGEKALASLEKYLSKGGIVGVRANMLAAEIYYSQKDFEKAAAAWTKAAEKGKKSYTAPLSNFNAAVAYEEAGKVEEAEKAYRSAIAFEDFDQIAHAKFSLGRLLEEKGNKDEALSLYTELYNALPDDPWAKLAKSRILVLGENK